jgi:hypothetical protein
MATADARSLGTRLGDKLPRSPKDYAGLPRLVGTMPSPSVRNLTERGSRCGMPDASSNTQATWDRKDNSTLGVFKFVNRGKPAPRLGDGYLWHLAGRAWLNCVVGSSITGRGLLKSRSCLTQALRQGFETGFEEVETAARFTSGSATFFVLKKSNLPQP